MVMHDQPYCSFRTFDVGKNDRHAIPPILTHAGELFDYARGDLSHQHKTVLSILEVRNQPSQPTIR